MIVKKYEIWCDDHNHEPDGQLLIEATNKHAAETAIRTRGWRVMSDGRTFCAECVSAATSQAELK